MTKPEVGASADSWGTKLNTDLDSLDAAIIADLNMLSGLTLSAAGSTATFGVAAGAAGAANGYPMVLASAYTKTASSWAVGSGNGSLDTGAIASATTFYHVFLIRRPDTGVVDILISLSATSPTMPTNYTQKRRIGALFILSSSQWAKMIQDGDKFLFDAPVLSQNNVALGTSSQQLAVTVPTGISVEAIVYANVNNASASFAAIFSDGTIGVQAITTPNGNANVNLGAAGSIALDLRLTTDTSGRIRGISNHASTTLYMGTRGWIDRRGRG